MARACVPLHCECRRPNAKAAGVSDRVRFVTQDLFQTDLHDATVVTLYLLPSLNDRLRPRLERELRPGSRVVSHSFAMHDWEPAKTATVGRKLKEVKDELEDMTLPGNPYHCREWAKTLLAWISDEAEDAVLKRARSFRFKESPKDS